MTGVVLQVSVRPFEAWHSGKSCFAYSFLFGNCVIVFLGQCCVVVCCCDLFIRVLGDDDEE